MSFNFYVKFDNKLFFAGQMPDNLDEKSILSKAEWLMRYIVRIPYHSSVYTLTPKQKLDMERTIEVNRPYYIVDTDCGTDLIKAYEENYGAYADEDYDDSDWKSPSEFIFYENRGDEGNLLISVGDECTKYAFTDNDFNQGNMEYGSFDAKQFVAWRMREYGEELPSYIGKYIDNCQDVFDSYATRMTRAEVYEFIENTQLHK